jgi:hypothetical protein
VKMQADIPATDVVRIEKAKCLWRAVNKTDKSPSNAQVIAFLLDMTAVDMGFEELTKSADDETKRIIKEGQDGLANLVNHSTTEEELEALLQASEGATTAESRTVEPVSAQAAAYIAAKAAGIPDIRPSPKGRTRGRPKSK